jgi:DMSO reductase anchor subunit
MKHTPVDFLLTTGFLGSLLGAALLQLNVTAPSFAFMLEPQAKAPRILLTASTALAWSLNQGIRLYRLHGSKLFEARAAYSLMQSELLRPCKIASFALIALSVAVSAVGHPFAALACGWAGVLLARYLFFVSVVPLNMALTFVRSRQA